MKWVIGWSISPGNLPMGVVAHGGRKLCVLTSERAAPQPSNRLSAMQQWFEAGLDFVPVSPARPISLKTAQAIGLEHETALQATAASIAGKGQYTLNASHRPPTMVIDRKTNGKEWLQARTKQRQSIEQQGSRAAELIADVVDGLNHDRTALRRHAVATSCDILVQRSDAQGFKSRLAQKLAMMQAAPDGLHMTLTGLWLPLSFASIPCEELSHV